MITHSIKKSFTLQLMGHQPHLPGRGRTFLLDGPKVDSQTALDDYIKEKSWAKLGTFLCFDHTGVITDRHQIHIIAGIERNFNNVPKPYNGYDKEPKCYRIICCNLHNGVTTWDRLDSLPGFRVLRKEELEKWVDTNDNLQDNLKLWQGQNGVEFPTRSNTEGPSVQGDSVSPGVGEV